MAIHPIDLSTVYSQMDKVAKYSASQNQQAQAASQLSNTQAANEQFQKTQGVQEAAQQDTDTAAKVRPDGKNNDAEQNASDEKKRKDESETDAEPRKQWEIKDPRVGNFIDISR